MHHKLGSEDSINVNINPKISYLTIFQAFIEKSGRALDSSEDVVKIVINKSQLRRVKV